MKFKHIYIVLKKELKDIFRDKKTWVVTILLPALFIPIMMYIVIGGAESISEQKVSDTKIVVVDEGNNIKFVNYLKSTGISIVKDLQNPKESLEKGDIRAILVIPSDFDKNIEEGKNADLVIQVDMSNNISPLMFIAIIPAYLVMYKMPNEIPISYFAIPVFGTISIFKELIYGIVNMTHIGIFAFSSIVYVGISIYI